MQQYRCERCGASSVQPVATELSLLKQYRFRTPAATICRVVALFALGLSKNAIEKRTGVKGETTDRIIKQLVTGRHWLEIRDLIIRKTGISENDLHDLDRRELQLEQTGEDLLGWQGIFYGRRPQRDRAELLREARKILQRKIVFGAGRR